MQSFSVFYLFSFLLSPSYPSSFNILCYANSISYSLLDLQIQVAAFKKSVWVDQNIQGKEYEFTLILEESLEIDVLQAFSFTSGPEFFK